MAHLQYMPGDPRLVDQLVYELKSKGIFDQFRKDCIADVDTRPAYQNLRQRVENSVATFLSRQCWKPDLNKNQLREKLRKHILDGNYLEQGVERIVDQVVNPKVASVFIPQVEDLVYNYLGISRKKTVTTAETSNGKISTDDLLPTDLEAVSPGSVKSNDDKSEIMDEDITEDTKMEIDESKDSKDIKDEEKISIPEPEKAKIDEVITISDLTNDTNESVDIKNAIPIPEDIKLENIPPPDNSPPKIELEKIELPKEPNIGTEIKRPDEIPLPMDEKQSFFKPIALHSDDESSSDSSLRRNMSPLTPIRNYNNENSCDAQQAFENDSDSKSNDKKEPSSFRFTIDAKSPDTDSPQEKAEKKDEQANLAYQFTNQVNINSFNTPMYDDSSNSNNLQIDYESDVNSKTNMEKLPETADQNTEDKKEMKKSDERKSSHKSSHRSRDSHRHSSSKDKRSDSKHSTSRDSSRHDKKKDDHSKSKSSHREKEREKSKDRGDKKDSRDSSKHRSSSHKSSLSHKDSKSHRSSSSSQKHSSDKKSDDKRLDDKRSDEKRSSSHRDKSERSSEKSSDKSSRDKRDSKSSSSHRDKDRKSSSKSKHDEKDKKKDKKDTDDHYSLSGRGNHGRRSTDRDSNDGSSSSKGSQNQSGTKSAEAKKENKESSSKSDNTSTSGESTSPSDKEHVIINASDAKIDTKTNPKPVRVENHLEMPIASPPRLPFVPDVTLKKPKFAANLEEAKRMIKMRKFLDEEQKRMNQEAALLLEFQANVRPSLSQVYSSIPGPELEFACVANETSDVIENKPTKTESFVENVAPNDTTNIEEENMSIDDVKDEIKDENPVTIDTEAEINEEITSPVEKTETYNENKPFSQLMDEITEYSKASEKSKKDSLDNSLEGDKNRTEYFEVTIIAEELSEAEEPVNKKEDTPELSKTPEITENVEEITEVPEIIDKTIDNLEPLNPEPDTFRYFAEHEKYDAEIKRHQYTTFLNAYTEKNDITNKIYLLNCDTYEENILKEVSSNFGTYEIVNYYKNGHLKLPKPAKNVVKDVNLATEISLPVENSYNSSKSPSPVFSPVKSECSFELSSDYDAKLEEMVNKTSRQEVMEIILGSVIDQAAKPTIDYCMDSSIDSEVNLKRKLVEVENSENNNRQVLTKIRKLSDSEQISSTTEESEEVSSINNSVSVPPRSKYLGRARRVGLPRPRRHNLPNSPSSDKSVENYEQNTPVTPQTPNGKLKTIRNKVQRYDTSDLYKPKLHYLSRRNNIS